MKRLERTVSRLVTPNFRHVLIADVLTLHNVLCTKYNVLSKADIQHLTKLCVYLRRTEKNIRLKESPLSVVVSFCRAASLLALGRRTQEEIVQRYNLGELPDELSWLLICVANALTKKYKPKLPLGTFMDMLKEKGDYSDVLSLFIAKHDLETPCKDQLKAIDNLYSTPEFVDVRQVEGWFIKAVALRVLAKELILANGECVTAENAVIKLERKLVSATQCTEKLQSKLDAANLELGVEKVGLKNGVAHNNVGSVDLETELHELKKANAVLLRKLLSSEARIKTLEGRGSSRVKVETEVANLSAEVANLNAIIAAYEASPTEDNAPSLDTVVSFLQTKRLMFVGGPIGFDCRLSTVLPVHAFTYIDVAERNSNFVVPENLDAVIINVRKSKHAHLLRASKFAKQYGIPVIDSGVSNIDILFRVIYNALQENNAVHC